MPDNVWVITRYTWDMSGSEHSEFVAVAQNEAVASKQVFEIAKLEYHMPIEVVIRWIDDCDFADVFVTYKSKPDWMKFPSYRIEKVKVNHG